MTKRLPMFALVAAVALVGTGSTVTDVDEPGVDPVGPVDGEWLVDELTVDGEPIVLAPSWPVTLVLDADVISGTAGCNRYTGVIDASAEAGYGRFVVSDLSWTEMACEPAVMEIEQAFLSALQAVDSYEMADGMYVAEAGVGTNFHLIRADQVMPPNTTEPLTSSTAPIDGLAPGGGLDGPVMYAARVDGDRDQMAALIIGTLELEGDCLYTAFEGNRYPVLWPFGTTWDEQSSSVVRPDGTELALGGEVYGGGGYLKPDAIGGLISDAGVLERAERCAEEPYFEIAVMQSTLKGGRNTGPQPQPPLRRRPLHVSRSSSARRAARRYDPVGR